MLKLIIEDDEGRKTVVPFVREEITIGRQEGNTIRLTERNVSRRHARLLRLNGHVVVEDLGSSNGTRINGERISGQSPVKDGDLIQIGDYDLALQSDAATASTTARMRPVASESEEEQNDVDASVSEPETETETPVQEDEANAAASAEQRRYSTSIIRMDHVEANRSRKVLELDPEEAPRLVVVSSELRGQEFSCFRTEMRIGRTEDNDIVIDHRSLSRTHAKIVREENGEWRIIDMQSANGLTVNGESYAQASLANGDVVELGHVKLRFVAAGESAGSLPVGGRSKLPLVLALVVLVLAGAVALYLLRSGPSKPRTETEPETAQRPTDPPAPPDSAQQPPPNEPRQVRTPEPQPPPNEPKPTAQPNPGSAVAQATKELEGRLQSAQKALAEGNLDKAEDELSPAKQPDGTWPIAAQPLMDKIAAERKVSQAIVDAQKAFDAKKYDESAKLLVRAESTTVAVFAQKRDALRVAVEEARKAQSKPDTSKPQPPGKPLLGPSPQEQARTAYEDAYRLHKAKQFEEAVVLGKKCLELDPNYSECHMLLGATYASMPGKMELAAKHYREFLRLAPDHRLAPKIKQNLEDYAKRNPTSPSP